MRVKMYVMLQTPELLQHTRAMHAAGTYQIGEQAVVVHREWVECPEDLPTMRRVTIGMMERSHPTKYIYLAILFIGHPAVSWFRPGFSRINDGNSSQNMADFLSRMRLDELIPLTSAGYIGKLWKLTPDEFIRPDADPANKAEAERIEKLMKP